MRILLIGGTGEARQIAERLAGDAGIEVLVSLAGRTADPRPYQAETVVGGFGGVQGLVDFLRTRHIDLLVDASHPFAATMTDHVAQAARLSGIPAIRLARPAWQPQEGDRWTIVASLEDAARAIGDEPRRVFLAVGRQSVRPFAEKPLHHYLIRSVEPVDGLSAFVHVQTILARGPFDVEAETALLSDYRIDVVVTKNSGGTAASAKLEAARALGLPVILVSQPEPGNLPVFEDVEAVLAEIARLRRSAGY